MGAEVAGRLDGEVRADLARARLGAEIRQPHGLGAAAQRQPGEEAPRAADDRALVDEGTDPRGERGHAQRTGRHDARVPDVGRFHLPPAAQRPGKTEHPRPAPAPPAPPP